MLNMKVKSITILSKFDEFHVQWSIYTEISVYILNGRESVCVKTRDILCKVNRDRYNVCEKSLDV